MMITTIDATAKDKNTVQYWLLYKGKVLDGPFPSYEHASKAAGSFIVTECNLLPTSEGYFRAKDGNVKA